MNFRSRRGSVRIIPVIVIAVCLLAGAGAFALSRGGASGYPEHPDVTATVFSAGEKATRDNAYISNVQSAWDKNWAKDAPHENPYYVALPVGDYLGNGSFNPENWRIPWHKDNIPGQSELKNRWIKVMRQVGGRKLTAYGQWEDVGPSEKTDSSVNDPDYVWGPLEHDPSDPITTIPKNTFGERAGIDLSPAMAQELGIDGSGTVTWRFVEAKDVPTGPWTKTITNSPPHW